MVLGTYANLSAIDQKSSGSFEERENILKHVDDSVERVSLNLSKPINESPEIQVEHLVLQDVTQSKLEPDLQNLPDQFDTLPKLPAEETKYHENPVDGVNLIDLKDLPAQRAPETEVKVIPLNDEGHDKQPSEPKLDDSKKSNDINNEAIQKEEQEIAIEKKEQNADDSQSELKRLEETKKLLQEVKEIKNVLEKQNQETQQLVLQKMDEIVDKVEKIEKVQEEDNRKHEEEKAEKIVAEKIVAENIPLEKSNVAVDKSSNTHPIVNQTMNGPIISMLINKQANQAEPSVKTSKEINVENKSKLTQDSAEEVHVPIQRDLLNVNLKEETTVAPSRINPNAKSPEEDLPRHRRDVFTSDEDCTKPMLNDGRKSVILDEEQILHDVKSDLDIGVKVGRDLKSVQEQ